MRDSGGVTSSNGASSYEHGQAEKGRPSAE